MPVDLTAYATAAEYRERTGRVSTSADTLVGTLLTTVSRVVDRRVGVADGMFNDASALAFTFDAFGGSLLRLRDQDGMQYLLRAVTANKIEIDGGDGAFDEYTLDFADAWVRGYPTNALALSRPFTAIELLSHLSTCNPSAWPSQVAAVRITGDWGWAAVPGGIKERVIGITRELIDVQHAGAAMSVTAVEDAIARVPSARSLMNLIEREFNYRIPGVA